MSPDSPFGRVVLGAVIMLYAVAVWGNGMDRAAREHPSAARLVPVPFRAEADRTAAATALSRQQPHLAAALAGVAVRNDPIDARSTALLGAARLLDRDPQGAEQAFRVSARFGWRDPLTQAYWYEAALQLGDYDLAALRLDALLRSGAAVVPTEVLTAPIEATPQGRAALARRLARLPVWVDRYLMPAGDLAKAALLGRAEVVTAAGGTSRLGCARIGPFTRALLERGERGPAMSVWQIHCPSLRIGGGIVDADFRQIRSDGGAAPFGWKRYAYADVEAEFAALPDGGAELRLRNDAPVSRLVLSQPVQFAPGGIRLQARVTIGGQPAVGRIIAALTCGTIQQLPGNVVGDLVQGGQSVAVPACDDAVLGLWLRPGPDLVTISNIRAVPDR